MSPMDSSEDKKAVKSFWEEAACGAALYLQGFDRSHYKLRRKAGAN